MSGNRSINFRPVYVSAMHSHTHQHKHVMLVPEIISIISESCVVSVGVCVCYCKPCNHLYVCVCVCLFQTYRCMRKFHHVFKPEALKTQFHQIRTARITKNSLWHLYKWAIERSNSSSNLILLMVYKWFHQFRPVFPSPIKAVFI